jgi:hypothetical protein
MSPIDIAETLRRATLLPDDQAHQLIDYERAKPFSLHAELRVLLYGGILTLATGLGLLLYDRTVTLDRAAILLGIGGLCAGCFWLAWRQRPVWSRAEVGGPGLGRYALLLGCLLLLALEGYAQWAYGVFGTRFGLATLGPGLLFVALAYRFDHAGVLALGLTLLTSWIGLTIRPLELFFKTNFFDRTIIASALTLGAALIGIGTGLQRRGVKPHFTFTYLLFAQNLVFVATLAGLFNLAPIRLLFSGLLVGVCVGFDWLARRERSFLLLLLTAIYGYIGLTYLFFHYGWLDFGLLTFNYFVLSGVGLIVFLLKRRPLTQPDAV